MCVNGKFNGLSYQGRPFFIAVVAKLEILRQLLQENCRLRFLSLFLLSVLVRVFYRKIVFIFLRYSKGVLTLSKHVGHNEKTEFEKWVGNFLKIAENGFETHNCVFFCSYKTCKERKREWWWWFLIFFFTVTKLEDWELPNTNFDKLQLCNIVDVKYDLGNTSSNNRCCDVMQLQRIDLIRRFLSCSIKINFIDEFLAGSFQSNWFTFIALQCTNWT